MHPGVRRGACQGGVERSAPHLDNAERPLHLTCTSPSALAFGAEVPMCARLWRYAAALILGLAVIPLPGRAQEIGDQVVLRSSNTAGVPVHPSAGDNSYWRWPNGTVAVVRQMDSGTGWLQVDAAGDLGWVTPRYATVISTEEEDPADELPSYVVGTWNLEHFHDGAVRGFPENTFGGESYPSRSDADFEQIAEVIRDRLDAKVLILNEVNGVSGQAKSVEMDRLLANLGPDWAYELSRAGGAQRVAILYNTEAVRRNACHEIDVPKRRIGGGDIFSRDPLTCFFTFLDTARQPMNDLVVVALHLASGQDKAANHDTAMVVLQDRLNHLFADGTYPATEKDVLIGGDMNASRYDSKKENFWEHYDTLFDFETLAPEDGTLYDGTRLSGVPLRPKSQIDYLFASSVAGGLASDLTQLVGHVNVELLPNDFTEYRRHLSDHIPVTVRIRVKPDDDPGQ